MAPLRVLLDGPLYRRLPAACVSARRRPEHVLAHDALLHVAHGELRLAFAPQFRVARDLDRVPRLRVAVERHFVEHLDLESLQAAVAIDAQLLLLHDELERVAGVRRAQEVGPDGQSAAEVAEQRQTGVRGLRVVGGRQAQVVRVRHVGGVVEIQLRRRDQLKLRASAVSRKAWREQERKIKEMFESAYILVLFSSSLRLAAKRLPTVRLIEL